MSRIHGATLALLIWLMLTAPLRGQDKVSGVVVDSISGAGIPGVLVFGDRPGVRTTTDDEGRFELFGVDLPATLRLNAFGYRPSTPYVVGAGPVTHRLVPAPVILEGVDVLVTRFRARLDSVHTFLDRSARGERWTSMSGGVPRIATREDLAQYDDSGDGEIALAALGLFPNFDFKCGWRANGRVQRPSAIFIDGERYPIRGVICIGRWTSPRSVAPRSSGRGADSTSTSGAVPSSRGWQTGRSPFRGCWRSWCPMGGVEVGWVDNGERRWLGRGDPARRQRFEETTRLWRHLGLWGAGRT